ncbi:ferredoxin-NADP reductase [Microbacteriaceae bacterium SG_E_30_P1]|uniref:Ferredoxin-NADP reductase n=1 Tax=Antiquaquibacter oligotrophicus TaxID=2880260 RepID=A0ABT6KJ95_9MICO|nr:oxidoreductase [Antiquaquibacter oligotrophicus]MDH6180006.1 ferredoxin-NADP reductase [Antiquaquibacter oligotrophicus]UDF14239.1 oxidoreductase [Antiquaquibacter oligotrophicus]
MKQWLDRRLGAVPMYKLVLFTLAAITITALVLSLFGQLTYQPLPILASALVAVGSAAITGWLASLIVRRPWHPESSCITGVLIALIIVPTLDPLGLLGIAVASTIATVSKYVLAFRGRHILNPAALGAWIIGLAGLGFPAWWTGTPFLQPVVIVGALLVLYRLRRLDMALVFVVVASVIRISLGVTQGNDLASVLSFTFLSSPMFFFVGFMLSEPLTTPPRRWQQWLVAGIAGVLFSVPFSIGPIYSDPLLALLVANLIAFVFGQRRAIRMTYLGKTAVNDRTWELSFQPKHPVHFVPGQYMELTIPHRKTDFRGSRRYFSIASAPDSEAPITFAITVPSSSSSFKKALLELEPGETVHGTGVHGDFVLPADVSQPLLLVAGGIGITPFASQLGYATDRGEKRDVVVVYATSTTGPLPYRELLERTGARVVLFAPEAPSPLPAGWVHAGTGRVDADALASAVPDAVHRRTFVSGPPGLVNELRRTLRKRGVRHIHTDYFSGY